MDTRWKQVTWGRGNPRQRTSETNWRQPLVGDRAAKEAGDRRKVFCASLADVFDLEAPDEWSRDLCSLFERTENLDWLLLTKRPELGIEQFGIWQTIKRAGGSVDAMDSPDVKSKHFVFWVKIYNKLTG